MKTKNIDFTVEVFHVGGRGGLGPVERLFGIGKDMAFTVFEADESGDSSWKTYEKELRSKYGIYGLKGANVVFQCLAGSVCKRKFYTNVEPDCSSLLKISPKAKDYTSRDTVWRHACQPAHTVELDVTTLDVLYNSGKTKKPHFLSLDAQGVECDILAGAREMALHGDLAGVLTEVEFHELYENQKLFTDTDTLLTSHHFILFELYNRDYWHLRHPFGEGALTVAEALYLRDYHYFIDKYKNQPLLLLLNLAKLAIIAYYFNRTSYAFAIVEYILNNWKSEWEQLMTKSNCAYLYVLTAFFNYWLLNLRLQKDYEQAMARARLI